MSNQMLKLKAKDSKKYKFGRQNLIFWLRKSYPCVFRWKILSSKRAKWRNEFKNVSTGWLNQKLLSLGSHPKTFKTWKTWKIPRKLWSKWWKSYLQCSPSHLRIMHHPPFGRAQRKFYSYLNFCKCSKILTFSRWVRVFVTSLDGCAGTKFTPQQTWARLVER